VLSLNPPAVLLCSMWQRPPPLPVVLPLLSYGPQGP
jgi:hypothetical protein